MSISFCLRECFFKLFMLKGRLFLADSILRVVIGGMGKPCEFVMLRMEASRLSLGLVPEALGKNAVSYVWLKPARVLLIVVACSMKLLSSEVAITKFFLFLMSGSTTCSPVGLRVEMHRLNLSRFELNFFSSPLEGMLLCAASSFLDSCSLPKLMELIYLRLRPMFREMGPGVRVLLRDRDSRFKILTILPYIFSFSFYTSFSRMDFSFFCWRFKSSFILK